jgi:hypothetical protein
MRSRGEKKKKRKKQGLEGREKEEGRREVYDYLLIAVSFRLTVLGGLAYRRISVSCLRRKALERSLRAHRPA